MVIFLYLILVRIENNPFYKNDLIITGMYYTIHVKIYVIHTFFDDCG